MWNMYISNLICIWNFLRGSRTKQTFEEIRAKNLAELKIITTQANWRTLIIRNKKKTSSNHRKSVMKGKTPKQPGGLHTNEYKNDSRLLENIASQMTVRNIFIVQKEVGKKKKKLSILILCLGRAPFKNEGEIQTI